MARGRLSVLAACLFLHSLASCQHLAYDYGFDVSRLVKRQEVPFVVRSLPSVNGTWPVRQEIRQLEKNKEQWTLYILGLSMMQFWDQSEPLSWYQISAIHGAPYQPWGGVQPTRGNQNSGYCNHISILFPTWHRPYLALFENVLYDVIQEIASLWSNEEDKNRYQAAAAAFRIPYWDWAADPPEGESILPRSTWESQVIDADGPNGVQQISNPLFAYNFHPLDTKGFPFSPWNVWKSTMRAPTDDDESAESNNTLVAMGLDQNLASVQQRLYTLFSNYHNYTTFSNEGRGPGSPAFAFDSLESLHDTVHSLAGGTKGHMAVVPFSGFDPLFYLHHAMVDRILTIWQALYPDSWVTPEVARSATFTSSVGQIQTSTTPLTPFYASPDGVFWNSDMVRDPLAFGYTYAEVAGLSLGGQNIDSRAQSSVKLAINRLYGSSSPRSLVGLANVRNVEVGPGAVREASTTSIPSRSVIVHNKYREWIANIRVKKQSLDGTFFIHFFLGSVPEEPKSWTHASTLVGTLSVFASPVQQGMVMNDPDTAGTVPLTAALVKLAMAGALPDLEAAVVKPYLQRNLHFTIIGANGTVFDTADVVSLHIQIASCSVQVPASDEELPTWGQSVTHFDLV